MDQHTQSCPPSGIQSLVNPDSQTQRVPAFVRLISLITAAIFILAASGKAFNPGLFIDIIESYVFYGFLPREFASITGFAVLSIESVLAVLLILRPDSKRVIGLTIALFIVFTLFVLSLLSNPPSSGCGCLGPSLPLKNPILSLVFALIRNFAFVTLLVQAYRAIPEKKP